MKIKLELDFFLPNFSYWFLCVKNLSIKKLLVDIIDFQKFTLKEFKLSLYFKLIFVVIYLQIA